MSLTKEDYIKYLYQEGVRAGVNKSPLFYQKLLTFIETYEGMIGFDKFQRLNPNKVGVSVKTSKYVIKRAF